jgi:hypothetical protein
MIYVCVPTQHDAPTLGLLLWKVRQVFQEDPREYQLLVAFDRADEESRAVLDRYRNALPVSIIEVDGPVGVGALMDELFRHALNASDRHKRDAVITLPGDFSVSPIVFLDLVRRFESGADLVIAEADRARGSTMDRLVRRSARWLLRPGLSVPGVHDLLSGVSLIRLITLRRVMRDPAEALLVTDGPCAFAELVARAASEARQISAISIPADGIRPPARARSAAALALDLFRAGRTLRVPEPETAVQRVS